MAAAANPTAAAAALPDWQYDNVQASSLAVISIFAALAIAAVVLRFLSRFVQKNAIGLDDWLSALGLTFTLGCYILSVKMIQYGSGRHTAAVVAESPQNIVPYLQCLYAYQIIYTLSILSIKGSILSLYSRIFAIHSFKRYIWICLGLVVAWSIAVILISIFSCSPIDGFWDKTMVPPARCVDTVKFYVGNAIPNIVTDLIILALPLRTIWKLRLTVAQKISLTGIFMLGGLVTASSIVRLVAQFQVSDPDFFWAMNATVVWTSLEPSFGTISACLPTYKPLARKAWPSKFGGGSSGISAAAAAAAKGSMGNSYKFSVMSKHAAGARQYRANGFDTLDDDHYDERLPIRNTSSAAGAAGGVSETVESLPESGILKTTEFSTRHD